MANTVTYLGYSRTPNGRLNYTGRYQITVSGNYAPGAGESVSLLNANNPSGIELSGAVPATVGAEVDTVGENIGGYQATVSNYVNGTFQMNLYASGGAELGAAAYPAVISGGSIVVAVPFQR